MSLVEDMTEVADGVVRDVRAKAADLCQTTTRAIADRAASFRSLYAPSSNRHVRRPGEYRPFPPGGRRDFHLRDRPSGRLQGGAEGARPIVIIAHNVVKARKFVEHYAADGSEVHITSSLADGFGALRRAAGAGTVGVIEIDSFGGICAIADALHDFRLDAPGIPLVLLSEEFSRTDLGAQRLPFCDASVRIPTGGAEVLLGAKRAAVENNRAWVLLSRDLQKTARSKTSRLN